MNLESLTRKFGMRDMTTAELKTWALGQWPCGCKTQGYLKGPAGGLCRNIQCPECGMQINVIDPESGFALNTFGQVLREPLGYKPPQETMALAVKSAVSRSRLSRFFSFLRLPIK
jgi:hypothetical protein